MPKLVDTPPLPSYSFVSFSFLRFLDSRLRRLTMTLAQRIRDCRYTRGWGPDELASRASISRTALYQIESGKTEHPRAGTLRRIAEALSVSTEALLGTPNGLGTVTVPWSGDTT